MLVVNPSCDVGCIRSVEKQSWHTTIDYQFKNRMRNQFVSWSRTVFKILIRRYIVLSSWRWAHRIICLRFCSTLKNEPIIMQKILYNSYWCKGSVRSLSVFRTEWPSRIYMYVTHKLTAKFHHQKVKV